MQLKCNFLYRRCCSVKFNVLCHWRDDQQFENSKLCRSGYFTEELIHDIFLAANVPQLGLCDKHKYNKTIYK